MESSQKTRVKSKVLFVTPTLKRSGSEIALAQLILNADILGIKICVLTFDRSGELVPLLREKRIKVLRLWSLKSAGIAGRLIGLFVRVFDIPLLKILVKIWKPDIVYANTITLHRLVNAVQGTRIATILHTHELEPMFAGLNESQTRELIEKPDFVIAASERAAQVFRTLRRTKPIAVVPSPIDFESLQSLTSKTAARRRANESFIWLMAGSLDANKNPVRFVEIARKYLMKRKQDRFVWLGGQETGYSLYAKSLAQQYGLANSISWVKPRDHEDYLNRFSAAHGIVITSDVESLSLVAIEGLALGKPVVSFDNGGTGEILGRKYGVLVPKYEIDFCVNKMTQIASGSLKFSASQLRKRAQEFDVSRVKDQWLQILESVAKQ
jgi:glycosyltransferase involved in cell wall biosynthesis